MIILGKGSLNSILKEIDLFTTYYTITGKVARSVKMRAGQLFLIEKEGKEYTGKNTSEVIRQVKAENNLFSQIGNSNG